MKVALFFVLFLLTLSGWAWDCRDLLAPKASKTQKRSKTSNPLTPAQWDRLSREGKIEKIRNHDLDSIDFTYDELSHPKWRRAVEEMGQSVLEKVEDDNIIEEIWNAGYIYSVGSPRPHFLTLFKIGETPVAIAVGMFQDGGATRLYSPPPQTHYDSHDEAKAALGQDYDLSDVSWQLDSYFELKEWKWKVLKIDIDEIGWQWSGY